MTAQRYPPTRNARRARDGAWAYEGGGTGPALSTDGGVRWRKVTAGLDRRRYCWAVAADPAQPACWYVAAARGPAEHTLPAELGPVRTALVLT